MSEAWKLWTQHLRRRDGALELWIRRARGRMEPRSFWPILTGGMAGAKEFRIQPRAGGGGALKGRTQPCRSRDELGAPTPPAAAVYRSLMDVGRTMTDAKLFQNFLSDFFLRRRNVPGPDNNRVQGWILCADQISDG